MPLTLITGPANAAKAGAVLERLRAALPREPALVVPTAADASHYARELAGAGIVFGTRVTTFSGLMRDIARAAGSSLRTLQRIFPRETGLSLDAWRQKARMIHAAARLSSGESVTAVALDCGYDSVSAFISAFQRQFGQTPGRYRAR